MTTPTPKPSKWAAFKAWLKKNLPGWAKEAVDLVVQWLIPFLLQHGMTFLVSKKRKAAYEQIQRDRVIPIPSELEHEDDC
jgi:hypothetical protein